MNDSSIIGKLGKVVLLLLMVAAVFFIYSIAIDMSAVIFELIFSGADLETLSAREPTPPPLFAYVIGAATGLAALWAFCNITKLGINLRAPRWPQVALIAGFFGLHLLTLILLGILLSVLGVQPDSDIESLHVTSIDKWGAWQTVLSVALIVPIFEEILFRGLLFGGLRQQFSLWPAFFISGSIFALLHTNFGAGWQHNLYAFLVIFTLSFYMTVIFEKTGKLWTAVGLHCLHNLAVLLLTIFYPSLTHV